MLVAIVLCDQTVYAYSSVKARVANKTITYKFGSFTEGIVNKWYLKYAWQNALSDWPNAYSRITVVQSSSTSNTLGMMNESSSYLYGSTEMDFYLTSGHIYYFFGKLNVGNPDITNTNVARSAANHELGHLLGIADLNSGNAIMNVNRNRSSIYVPQTDDVNGVIATYTTWGN